MLTPRIRLVRPVNDGRGANIWIADHIGLATGVEVTFADRSADSRSTDRGSAEGSASARAFELQARATASVNDPHLVRILEHGEVNGIAFLVTQLLEGKSLRRRLSYGPVSVDEVQTIVLQACDALGKAHSLGITHGGLRPDCLFAVDLANQPFIEIAGFGTVASSSGEAAATNPYASPEQLLLGTGSDARSDLWALAVSAYELLTGTLPFEAPTPAGVTVAICNGQFALPSRYRADLPARVDGWFAKALAKDPAHRHENATELARGLVQAFTMEAAHAVALPSAPLPTSTFLPAAPSGVTAPRAASSAPEASPYEASTYEASTYEASAYEASAYEASAYEASAYEASAYEASAYEASAYEASAAGAPAAGPFASAPAAFAGSLEMNDDDGEEDEKTVKWDLPDEWSGKARGGRSDERAAPPPPSLTLVSTPGAAMLPRATAQHPAGSRASAASSTIPPRMPSGTLTSRTPAANALSPNAVASSRVTANTVQPHLQRGAYLDSPYLASVASAIAVPSPSAAVDAPAASARPSYFAASSFFSSNKELFSADKTWLAALAFAAGVAVTWFSHAPNLEGDALVAGRQSDSENGTANIRTVSVDDLPPVTADDEKAREEDLPVIVQPHQLPRATDEVGDERPVATLAPSGRPSTVALGGAVRKVQALSPVAANAPKAATPARAKPVEARGNCSPPYHFDSQGIQRLKAECIGGSGVITGPYGAVLATNAEAKVRAPIARQPASEKQARASSNCSPPYYFEGKIRRLKLDCL